MKRTKSHRTSARILEVAILIALPILSHYLIPVMIVIPRPYSYLGAGLMLLSLTLMIWTAMLFREERTSFQLRGGSSALVTSGPFQFSRNPMYLGMLIWLVGLAVLLGSLIAFLFPILFFLLANLLVIPPEEKRMEHLFGEQFIEYKRRVRRWFGSYKEENTMIEYIIILIGALGVVLIAGWLGLQVKPKPFTAYAEQTPALNTVELPADLPAPVARYYETIMGDQIPVIESAVISGRGRLRIKGITFPARFRFTHVAGQGYRHYIEATIFGYPVMKVNEWYLDGHARMELPVGVIENEPKIDMAANLALWGEAIWLPSILVTDPRVRWEAIDDTTARLVVPFDLAQDRPFGEEEDTFTVTFDPQTGLMRTMEAMRYREATDEAKIPWRNEPLGWQTFHGVTIPSPAATTWLDEGTPWAVWTIEDVVYNVDVSEYIRANGY